MFSFLSQAVTKLKVTEIKIPFRCPSLLVSHIVFNNCLKAQVKFSFYENAGY